MDMDTFFSETNIASLRHLALPGVTTTDRTALFRVLSERFINAQNLAKHQRLAFARRQSQSECSSVLAKDEGKRQMENLAQLQAKLDRTQAEIEKGIVHLIKQRARVAHRLGESQDATQCRERLAALEDTQLLHVQHRDRLRRKLDWTLAGNKAPSCAIPPAGA